MDRRECLVGLSVGCHMPWRSRAKSMGDSKLTPSTSLVMGTSNGTGLGLVPGNRAGRIEKLRTISLNRVYEFEPGDWTSWIGRDYLDVFICIDLEVH